MELSVEDRKALRRYNIEDKLDDSLIHQLVEIALACDESWEREVFLQTALLYSHGKDSKEIHKSTICFSKAYSAFSQPQTGNE